MIVGQPQVGSSPLTLPGGTLYVLPVTLAEAQRFASLTVYVDSLGTGNGPARMRGAVYHATSNVLLASGDVVVVDDDQDGAWIDLPLPDFQGTEMAAGDYLIGVQTGGTSNVLRIYRNTPGIASSLSASDTFPDGLNSPAPALTSHGYDFAIFAVVFDSFVVPPISDADLARLPWELTQRAFSTSGPITSTRVGATCGWHGTTFDPEEGANVVVRSDGPLADRVGERLLLVRHAGGVRRTVAVFCHDELDFPAETADEDLSLTRRAFLALGECWEETISVEVATLG